MLQQGVTLLLINLQGSSVNRVSVTSEGAHGHTARRRPGRKFAPAAGATREEYHLTPKGGNIQSQVMMLNGKALVTGADGSIPRMEPVRVDAAQHIVIAPYSIVFAHIPYFHAPACS